MLQVWSKTGCIIYVEYAVFNNTYENMSFTSMPRELHIGMYEASNMYNISSYHFLYE